MQRLLTLLLVQYFVIVCSMINIQTAFCADASGKAEHRWAFLVDIVECATPEETAKRVQAIKYWKNQMRELGIPDDHIFSCTLAEGRSEDVCQAKLKSVYSMARHRLPKNKTMLQEGDVEIHLVANADTKIIQKLFDTKAPPSEAGDKHAERVFLVLNCIGAPPRLGKADDGNSGVWYFKDNKTPRFAHSVFITQNQDFCLFYKPEGWKLTENLQFFELLREGLAGRCMLKNDGAERVMMAELHEYMRDNAKLGDQLSWANGNGSFPLGDIKEDMKVEIPKELFERTGKVFTLKDYQAEKESANMRAGNAITTLSENKAKKAPVNLRAGIEVK